MSPEFSSFIDKIQSYSLQKDDYHRSDNISLTPREVTIIKCIMQGMSNKEIAKKLMLAEVTVKKNIGQIFKKYNVHNRTALIYALQMEGAGKKDLS